MKCKECNSTFIETDYNKGSTYCLNCNVVCDEINIVSDVCFDNTKVIGTFVSDNQHSSSLKNKHGNYICDSRQSRINKANQEIICIAEKLSINSHIVDMAKKCYLIAADQKFLQGRKTKLIVGIILYSLCRQNKTMHLLIDFSDVLQTNLYVLGNLYLKLIKLLNFKIPQIDPSLFIQRFCNKLKLGDQTNAICITALKILQSMKRNWLHLGRRPNGLCGAAILIASSCHQKKKSLEEVVEIVHVCNGTIKKRLAEFTQTPTSFITKEELDNVPLIDSETFELMMDERGMDPPSYIANRLKDLKIYESDVIKKTMEIEKKLFQKLNSFTIKPEAKVRIVFQKTTDKIDSKRYVLEPYPKDLYSKNKKNKKKVGSSTVSTQDQTLPLGRKSSKKSSRSVSLSSCNDYNSEDLSDLNDDEVETYCLSIEEQRLKKNLWEVMYSDWIIEQELKKKDQDKKLKEKVKNEVKEEINLFVGKKRKVIPPVNVINNSNIKEIGTIDSIYMKSLFEHDTPVDAIKSSKKFPKNTNISNLTKLFS